MDVTFFLPTDIGEFALKLTKILYELPERASPTEDGFINLSPRVQHKMTSYGIPVLTVEAYREEHEGTDKTALTLLGDFILFEVTPRPKSGDIMVEAQCELPVVADCFQKLLVGIDKVWPEAKVLEPPQGSEEPLSKLPGKRGAPKLENRDNAEYIYRLTKAQEAEAIKAREPDTPWRIIAQNIGWRYGKKESAVKLLHDARKRLKAASPEVLRTVEENRKEKK